MNRSIIKIHNGDFAIVKSKKSYKNAFANINDGKEISVILEQDKINYKDIIEIERDWKLIIFDMVLGFGLIGFIFKISSALAEANISIFVISSYSTDHILIKKKNLKKALNMLIYRKISKKSN